MSERMRQDSLWILTQGTHLVLEEALGDVGPDDDGLAWDLPRGSSEVPLPPAVVDEPEHPPLVLADDGAPEEFSICPVAAVPFIRQALTNTREPEGFRKDSPHTDLRPVGDVVVLWDVPLVLDGFHPIKQLLNEAQGAVVVLRQEEALQDKIRKGGGATYGLLVKVLVEGLLGLEAFIDPLEECEIRGVVYVQ